MEPSAFTRSISFNALGRLQEKPRWQTSPTHTADYDQGCLYSEWPPDSHKITAMLEQFSHEKPANRLILNCTLTIGLQ